MPRITLTKIDSAERQLREAIRLFFEDRDPVAVHTLVSAAGQLTSDLLKARGLLSIFRSGVMIRPERKTELLRIMVAPENFLKHADRDPDATLEFNTDATAFFIFAALAELKQLTGADFHPGRVFNMWFYLSYPDVLADVPENATVRAEVERLLAAGHSPEDKRVLLDLLDHPPDETQPRMPSRA